MKDMYPKILKMNTLFFMTRKLKVKRPNAGPNARPNADPNTGPNARQKSKKENKACGQKRVFSKSLII